MEISHKVSPFFTTYTFGALAFKAGGLMFRAGAASATLMALSPTVRHTASAKTCFLNPKTRKEDVSVKTFFIIIIPKIMYVVAL